MPVRLECSEELRGGLCSSRKEATGVRFHRGSWATGSPEWGARTDVRAGTTAMVSVWTTHTGEERREAGNLMQNCPWRGRGGTAGSPQRAAKAVVGNSGFPDMYERSNQQNLLMD